MYGTGTSSVENNNKDATRSFVYVSLQKRATSKEKLGHNIFRVQRIQACDIDHEKWSAISREVEGRLCKYCRPKELLLAGPITQDKSDTYRDSHW